MSKEKSTKRGRPTVTGSARQARLEARAARVAAGGEVKRGRPASTGSARQAKLAIKAAKIAAGETIKRGRPASAVTKAPKATKAKAVVVESVGTDQA
jgi:hypothetical protein